MVASVVGLDAAVRISRDGFRLEVELAIAPGTTAALLGPNGSGKSTLVSTLAGILPLEAGRIELAGRVLDDPSISVFVSPASRRVGVVFQDYLLFPGLSVLENVAFGLRAGGVPRREAREAALGWLQRFELQQYARRSPSELSGGQAQLVALARALATEPLLLLLDEPLGALDVSVRGQVRRVLAEHLQQFDGPRLLITHDPNEAFLLADVIHVIEGGAITQSGSADEIRLRPRTSYAAHLAGSNLLTGVAAEGEVEVGGHRLQVASETAGPVLLTIRPNAISIHRKRPEGSARNVWSTDIELVEPLGERVRVRTGGPIRLTAEVSAASAADLGLGEDEQVWLSIKATEIGVEPEGPPA